MTWFPCYLLLMRCLFIAVFLFFTGSAPAQHVTKAELLGQFDPTAHPDFVKIDAKYTSKPAIYLRREAYAAFELMHAAAAAEGIDLTIISATRNFEYQKGIWERKWNRTRYMGWSDFAKAKDILTYSSMPGSSRHHWGTDIDLNALSNDWFSSGEGKRVYDWLTQHGPSFGYWQVYTTKDEGRKGYNEEKWHWSYLPLATTYLETYNDSITASDIRRFRGAALADSLLIIEDYVNGVER